MNVQCRLLLVEDQPTLRATLTRALRLNRFEVEAVGTLPAARQCLTEQSFDVLLSDVSLENSDDGFVLAQWTRTNWPSMPIVLMSGLALHDPPKDLASDPAIRMLPKPFPVATLVEACRICCPGQ
jgi:DNA-binding NtrC family response regulator